MTGPAADVGIRLAPSQGNAAAIQASDSAWHDIHQTIAVKPFADYLLTVNVYSSNVTLGAVGVRTTQPASGDSCNGFTTSTALGSTLAAATFGTLPAVTTQQVRFNPGARSEVDVFAGFTATGSAALLEIPSVSVTPLNLLSDSGFEMQPSGAISWPYSVEGAGAKGIDDHPMGYARTGVTNAWINTADTNEWNSIDQVVIVQPNTNYVFEGWVVTSSPFGAGSFGVRDPSGRTLGQASFWCQRRTCTGLRRVQQRERQLGHGLCGDHDAFSEHPDLMRLDDPSPEPSAPPCSATTSCAGIIGGPPELTVTCPVTANFFDGER